MIVQSIRDDFDGIISPDLNDITNCKNCGAPLTNYKCKYCGTEYNQNTINAYSGNGNIVETYIWGGIGNSLVTTFKCLQGKEDRSNEHR